MRKIRIGNDISITIYVRHDGKPADFTGRQLTLFLVNGIRKEQVEDFTVKGDVISFVFKGTEQKHMGKYYLTLYENYGEGNQNVSDTFDAFELVSRSTLADGSMNGGCPVSLDVSLDVSFYSMSYNKLEDKPGINGVTLVGNKTLSEIGVYSKEEVDEKLAQSGGSGEANQELFPFKLYYNEYKTTPMYGIEEGPVLTCNNLIDTDKYRLAFFMWRDSRYQAIEPNYYTDVVNTDVKIDLVSDSDFKIYGGRETWHRYYIYNFIRRIRGLTVNVDLTPSNDADGQLRIADILRKGYGLSVQPRNETSDTDYVITFCKVSENYDNIKAMKDFKLPIMSDEILDEVSLNPDLMRKYFKMRRLKFGFALIDNATGVRVSNITKFVVNVQNALDRRTPFDKHDHKIFDRILIGTAKRIPD